MSLYSKLVKSSPLHLTCGHDHVLCRCHLGGLLRITNTVVLVLSDFSTMQTFSPRRSCHIFYASQFSVNWRGVASKHICWCRLLVLVQMSKLLTSFQRYNFKSLYFMFKRITLYWSRHVNLFIMVSQFVRLVFCSLYQSCYKFEADKKLNKLIHHSVSSHTHRIRRGCYLSTVNVKD